MQHKIERKVYQPISFFYKFNFDHKLGFLTEGRSIEIINQTYLKKPSKPILPLVNTSILESIMNLVQHTFETLHPSLWLARAQRAMFSSSSSDSSSQPEKVDFLFPARKWLDELDIKDSAFAHRICKMIPSQCPFEREIKLLGHTLVKIPPMCKLNPLYDEVVALRFRAICYLADTCGEDVSIYC